MKNQYNLLRQLIKLNNINKFVITLLTNYNIFNKLKELKYINIGLARFDLSVYTENSFDNNNLYLMFLICQKKFFNLIEKKSKNNFLYKNEINNNKSENKYCVIATNTKINLNIFKAFLLFYYVEGRILNKTRYIGVDFEFNTKIVALMQINFEQVNIDLFKKSIIFLFDPNQLETNWNTFFVHKIICDRNTYKILHGSDSLDMPFVYDVLLKKNKSLIKKFTSKFIDTKFLCEYNYYFRNLDLGKCKIYYVLLNEGIITNQKFDELQENEKNMGPIYDIIININTLNESLVIYTLYDVLFLVHFLQYYKREIPDYNLVIELTQFSFLEKRNITNHIPIKLLQSMNNYNIKLKGSQLKLNNIFTRNIEYFIERFELFKNINKINYFRKNIISVLKFIMFRNICSKFKVMKNKNIKFSNHILLKHKLHFLNDYPNFNKLVISYNKFSNNYLDKLNQ